MVEFLTILGNLTAGILTTALHAELSKVAPEAPGADEKGHKGALSSTEEGLERRRYIEVDKLRNTAHLQGRHKIVIGPRGISVVPHYRQKRVDIARGSGKRLGRGAKGKRR